MQKSRLLHLIPVGIALMLAVPADAAEERLWLSRKGDAIRAQLQRVDGEFALLATPDLKEPRVKIEDLSLVDRMYLVEYGGADPKIISGSDLGIPEKDTRIDTRTFKRLEKPIQFGQSPELAFETLETSHFLVATAGKIRPNAVAEIAERLWHGMAFQHINFREDWQDKRMLILMVADEDTYAALGDWYKEHLQKQKGEQMQEHAARTRILWDQVSSTSIYLPEEMAKEHNIFERAKIFNIGDRARLYGDVFAPFPTHSLAGTLLSHQAGGVADWEELGYFAITTGHAYFKEIQLAKETATSLIDAELYENNDITKSEGFQDGTSWAKELKALVRKGKLEPDLEKMFTWEQQNLTPEGLVLIYSFGYYLQSTPERAAAYANLLRRIEYASGVPTAPEIAKLYGFASVEEFQADWIKFIESPAFK